MFLKYSVCWNVMLLIDIVVGVFYDDMGKVFIYYGVANGINIKLI